MENFILIFCCLAVGMVLQRHHEIDAAGLAKSLNLYVIYVALPALVLAQLPSLAMDIDIWILVVMPWLMVVSGWLMLRGAAQLFHWPREVVGCLLLCAPLANTSFLGIPMVQAFWGQDMAGYAVIYDQLGSFLALSTYGTVVLATYGGDKQPKVTDIMKKISTFPPFLALLVGMAMRWLEIPPQLTSVFGRIGESLVPTVMVAVGLQLKIRLPGHYRSPFAVGLLIKLCLAPLLALLFYRWSGQGPGAGQIAVFEAGMPPMISAGALAMMAGLAPELAAALVGWGIVLSFATLSGLYLLLV